MLKDHSVTPEQGDKMTDPGRPRTVTDQDLLEAYAGSYKDPEVVNRWLDWESD